METFYSIKFTTLEHCDHRFLTTWKGPFVWSLLGNVVMEISETVVINRQLNDVFRDVYYMQQDLNTFVQDMS